MDPISTKIALGAAGAGGGDSYWLIEMGNNSDTEVAYSATTDSSNNIIFAGKAADPCLNVKLDPDGAILWQRTLSSTYNFNVKGVVCDSSDDIYTVCTSANTASTYGGGNVFKRNGSTGQISWQRLLEHPTAGDEFNSIAVDSSNNVYICGNSTNGSSGGSQDLHFAKYSSAGSLLFQTTLRHANRVEGHGIAVDSSGNIYVTGYYYTGSGYASLVAKFNSSGSLLWQQQLTNGSTSVYTYHLTVDSSANVYVLARTNTGSDNAPVIVKYNSSGTIQWQRSLGGITGSTTTNPGEIAVDSTGNVYFCAASNVTGNYRGIIAKYNSSGVLQWQRYLNGPNNSTRFQGMDIDSSDNVIAVGENVDVNTDLIAFKVPNDGSLTGTYSGWVYGVSTLTDAPGPLTDSGASLSSTNGAMTGSTTSYTDATSTVPYSLITTL